MKSTYLITDSFSYYENANDFEHKILFQSNVIQQSTLQKKIVNNLNKEALTFEYWAGEKSILDLDSAIKKIETLPFKPNKFIQHKSKQNQLYGALFNSFSYFTTEKNTIIEWFKELLLLTNATKTQFTFYLDYGKYAFLDKKDFLLQNGNTSLIYFYNEPYYLLDTCIGYIKNIYYYFSALKNSFKSVKKKAASLFLATTFLIIFKY